MAAWVLGELRETKAVPALTELLRQSDEPGAIEAAVEALGKIGPTSAVSVLANSSRWPLRVRIKVAEALGSIGEVKTEKALLTMLQDPSSLVKSLAADALSRLLQGARLTFQDFKCRARLDVYSFLLPAGGTS